MIHLNRKARSALFAAAFCAGSLLAESGNAGAAPKGVGPYGHQVRVRLTKETINRPITDWPICIYADIASPMMYYWTIRVVAQEEEPVALDVQNRPMSDTRRLLYPRTVRLITTPYGQFPLIQSLRAERTKGISFERTLKAPEAGTTTGILELEFDRPDGGQILAEIPTSIFFRHHDSKRESGRRTGREGYLRERLAALRTGDSTERRTAAYAIWEEVRYRGHGDVGADEMVAAFDNALLDINDDDVHCRILDTLKYIDNECVVSLLVRGLGSGPRHCAAACKSLRFLGPTARAAIPALTKGIRNDTLPVAAFEALLCIQGPEAFPVIYEAIKRRKLNMNQRHEVAWALDNYPDPGSISFMEEQLFVSYPCLPTVAALFFARLDHPKSMELLRKCLKVKSQGTNPLSSEFRDPADLRSIASRYLAMRRDDESFRTILGLAASDPSIMVRTAATEALGVYGREGAVPVLAGLFVEKEGVSIRGRSGYGAQGYRGGELYEAAAKSLASIGTKRAIRGLYDGLSSERGLADCRWFWLSSKTLEHAEWFLEFNVASPLKDRQLAATIIVGLLRTHRRHYEISPGLRDSTWPRVLGNVVDRKRFAKDGKPLSTGVSMDFTRYRNGFMLVSFARRGGGGRSVGMVEDVLYQKTDIGWVPVAP